MNENQALLKKVLIVIVIILICINCILMIIKNKLNIKNEKMQESIATGNFESIKDILEFYNCKYIKEEKSKVEGFKLDIYTNFKYDLYDGEESNEEFYNKVIYKIANFLNYESFIMIDESKSEKIEIKVIGNGKKIKTIIINDIEDYFMYMDSQIDAKKFKIIPQTDIVVESPELLECIQNNWDKSTNFGIKESTFQNYDVYLDEGIMVKNIQDKVYNIVFSRKYAENIVKNLNSSAKYDIIIRELGEPAFKNSNKSIIGYKSKDLYIFFSNGEVSIFRNTDEDYESFFQLIDEYLAQKYTFIEFMNELTYIWPDYETYEYFENSMFIAYPTKGIEIKLNYDNISGIILYNNIGFSQDIAKKYLENTDFISQMRIDSIYNSEQRRLKNKRELKEMCDEYKKQYEEKDSRNHGAIYDYYMKFDMNKNIQAIYFVSNSENYSNNQLIENINKYIWIDDTTFVYSKAKRGIYSFNLATGEKNVIITGKENFNITSYEDGILCYDETSINL